MECVVEGWEGGELGGEEGGVPPVLHQVQHVPLPGHLCASILRFMHYMNIFKLEIKLLHLAIGNLFRNVVFNFVIISILQFK